MTHEKKTLWLLGLVGFGAFGLLLGLEIAEGDELTPLQLLLEVLELTLLIVATVGLALLVGRMRAQHEEKMMLLRELEGTRTENREFQSKVKSHLDGLGAAIEKQFEAWALTSAEREIGIFMLKGFGHREIAALRGTSEPTVRQQARGIYQKSGLESRTAFCAFFLEGLLPSSVPNTSNAVQATAHAPSHAMPYKQ